MSPGTGETDIEMVSARLGLKPTLAAWAGRSVCGDPVAELALAANEVAPAGRGIVPEVVPLAVDQQSHFCLLLIAAGTLTTLRHLCAYARRAQARASSGQRGRKPTQLLITQTCIIGTSTKTRINPQRSIR